ncbi:MAG: serine--tRNA ligase [Candidatus Sungbacteria bacterium RIFCSPLOWO2_12_FULL_41_11]|uniref:Serine--tRNA ligase n=1 Tax=Candidatus Sungbacteria bacterium RIFCSPLOWO2_12_FULL_41_11 TaxID=1802286 RepID=A0A1G2LTJ6_9BACT|nr:MAG: Serine-tRNA ligase [Parcubacteria group bacterium GW2011_GWA2_42_14]OGZ99308.1 MAG: serine--tRNA ligase [Candidatus Sungbacteria bacterium RIFCSPHIGHO2_02_FULL_41_12b]OHA14834.1 MAG: serine--tRNA ligase [Candidatus Sungbacteria bacterium RIFCSPLOWO2_12_FULL_41_11]
MLDIKFIRENPDKTREGLKKKGMDFDLDYLLSLDEKRRKKIQEVDEMRARQNALSGEIATARKSDRDKNIAESKELKIKLGDVEFELKAIEEEFEELTGKFPNLPLDNVPVGAGERDNVAFREIGERPKFSFETKDHLELGINLGIIDFETGAKVSGSDFYYLKNAGVMLELALVQYALEFLSQKGFSPRITPDLARSKFYLGTGYLPRGSEAQTYMIEDSDLGLIATAEVTLAGIHADEILDNKQLPIYYAGYSHCFRRESGSYGKYSKGLYRVHQFTKVEMFVYCRPEDSPKIHEDLLGYEEKLWQGLGIPYRVVEMCAGDLGAQAARKFDLEAWMPGRKDWGEVTSTSNTTDYQARRLGIKYRDADGKIKFVHTLNGTAIAVSRAIIAILENYQQEDGSVEIPEVLQKYMGGMKDIRL